MPSTSPPRHFTSVLVAGAVIALVAPLALAWSSGAAGPDSTGDPDGRAHAQFVADSHLSTEGARSTGAPVAADPSRGSAPVAQPTGVPSPAGREQHSGPAPDPVTVTVTGTASGRHSQHTGRHTSPSDTTGSGTAGPGTTSRTSAAGTTGGGVVTETATATATATETVPPPPTTPTVTVTGGPAVTVTVPPTVTVTVPPTVTVTVPPAITVTVTAGGGAPDPGVPDPGGSVPAPAPNLPPGTGQPSGITSSTGWHSGASGSAATSGSFGAWRGKPVQVIAIWGDTSASEQASISSLRELDGFDGDVDVAVGALASGETWAQAAQGAYTARWREAVRNIAAHRAGKPGTTYVRFAHEMNGDWFTWKVNSGNLAAFQTSWRLFHDILAQEYPAARLVFSPNNGSHSDITVTQMYPGDDLVDVIGVDIYDGWPNVTDQATWDSVVNSTEQGGQPLGIGSWQRFAAAHNKPLSLPEWGLQFGDHPAFIKGMHDFLAANAARPGETALGGKVVYDVYFDIAHGGNTKFMLTGSANPQAAALYRSLTWGT